MKELLICNYCGKHFDHHRDYYKHLDEEILKMILKGVIAT